MRILTLFEKQKQHYFPSLKLSDETMFTYLQLLSELRTV